MLRSASAFALAILCSLVEPGPAAALDVDPGPTPAVAWSAFEARHGDWHIEWSGVTGTPRRAWGEGVRVASGVADAVAAESAALAFLRDHPGVTKAEPSITLRSLSVVRAGRVWYAHFQQLHEGIPVLLSDVGVRLDVDGRVFAFASEIHGEIDVSDGGLLDIESVRVHARSGLDFIPGRDRITGGENAYILPVEEGEATGHALVRHVRVSQVEPRHEWEVLVDAHTGLVRLRFDRVRYGSVTGKVSAEVAPPGIGGAKQDHLLDDIRLTAGEATALSDGGGGFVFPQLLGSVTVRARLAGPQLEVVRDDGFEPAVAQRSVAADGHPVVDLHFDDGNSHPAERAAFVHASTAHDWIREIDPGFSSIDELMPCRVNIDQSCNAFWDGTAINFFSAGMGCNNTARVADIVFHEYAHGINDRLYEQLGQSLGMINAALHEGLADATANLIEDDPILGQEFYEDGTGHLRRSDGGRRYPESFTGRAHTDGQILAGAIWDLRSAIGLEQTALLVHQARYGLPDDSRDTRVAFDEYFLELLVADDDDGDLSNGTPHLQAIVDAFDAHGLGPRLSLDFAHVEAQDQPIVGLPTTIEATIRSESSLFPLEASSPRVVLFVDGKRESFVPMVHRGAGRYEAAIAAQPASALVRYHLEAAASSGSPLSFPLQPEKYRFSYLVGTTLPVRVDDFEDESGWTVGAPDDGATAGLWERGDPEATSSQGRALQPGDDHSPQGSLCFVTGAASGESPGSHDVDGGRTTLFSPVFDLSDSRRPVIRYHRWFSNDLGASPRSDRWRVEISNDGGESWVEVENTYESDARWRKILFRVAAVLPPTDRMRLRFIATDQGGGSLVEAAVDDVDILSFGEAGGVPPGPPAGPRFVLHPNQPNPFNPSTTLAFDLPEASVVSLVVYDRAGRQVAVLAGGPWSAGPHAVIWDGTDRSGRAVASGVYLARLVAGNRRQSRAMVLVR